MALVLLGQLKAVSGKGMLVSFIDFKKAYDRVDRGKFWGCLKGMGIGGWASPSLSEGGIFRCEL